jgi:hypothetical protein
MKMKFTVPLIYGIFIIPSKAHQNHITTEYTVCVKLLANSFGIKTHYKTHFRINF